MASDAHQEPKKNLGPDFGMGLLPVSKRLERITHPALNTFGHAFHSRQPAILLLISNVVPLSITQKSNQDITRSALTIHSTTGT